MRARTGISVLYMDGQAGSMGLDRKRGNQNVRVIEVTGVFVRQRKLKRVW